MPSLGWYFHHTMQRIGTQIMEMICDWHYYVAFHAGGVQATCTICSCVDVLRVVFNLKTKQLQLSHLLSIQMKSQTSTLRPSLHNLRPCLQSCPTLLAITLPRQDHLRLGCSEAWGYERAIKAEKERKKPSYRSRPCFWVLFIQNHKFSYYLFQICE